MVSGIKRIYHFFEAVFASMYYGYASNKITVIGVTGTDGKTTTAHCLYHTLVSCGKKVSLVSSIYADIGGNKMSTGFHVTTPRAWVVQRLIKEAVEARCEYFILETTSHAIDQYRVWGIKFRIALLTNISHEHLFHHKTFDAYRKLKTKLLLNSDTAVINRSDSSYKYIKGALILHGNRFVTYSLEDRDADYTWPVGLNTKLTQSYNRENILGALAVCGELNLNKKDVLRGASTFILPQGRFEIVCTKPFIVIVDFAHTPNSIEKLLTEVKKQYLNSRIIHVFGAASQRDDSKRPLMGKASTHYSNCIILTEEDYRLEDPISICAQIAVGIEQRGFKYVNFKQVRKLGNREYTSIIERDRAIEYALSQAKRGDVVVVTGKSHEKSLNRNGTEYPWDEYEVIKKILSKKL